MLSSPGVALATLNRRKQDQSIPGLAKLLRHEESACVIGREYLRNAPQEKDREILFNLISSGLGQESVSMSDDEALRKRLRLQIRRDFAAERVVRVHGWILSITEARLCALAALVSNPPQSRRP
jgi:hypothetical protein